MRQALLIQENIQLELVFKELENLFEEIAGQLNNNQVFTILENTVAATLDIDIKTTKKVERELSNVLDKKVDKIYKELIRYNDGKIPEIEGYGKLTKAKLKQLLIDKDEARKFLAALGMDSIFFDPTPIVERIVTGKMSVITGFKMIIMETVYRFKSFLKTKETTEKIKKLAIWYIKYILLGFIIGFIALINTFLFSIGITIGLSINPILGGVINLFGAVFVAPLLEEFFKYVSTKANMSLEGIIQLPVYEMVSYIINIAFVIVLGNTISIPLGIVFIVAILIRIPALLLHLINFARAKFAVVSHTVRKNDDELKIIIAGNLFIHMVHNLLGSLAAGFQLTGVTHVIYLIKDAVVASIIWTLEVLGLASIANFVVNKLKIIFDKLANIIIKLGDIFAKLLSF